MTEHAHDEQGNCIPPQGGFYEQTQPNWRFSFWDVAATGTYIVGALVGGTLNYFGSALHQGCNMLGKEFAAAANFSRQTKELEEANRLNEAARHQMSVGLEQIVYGPTDGDLS